MIDDVVEGFEDAVGEPVLPHELPHIFLAVEFRCARRRMFNVLDEFTHECLAIRVARRLKKRRTKVPPCRSSSLASRIDRALDLEAAAIVGRHATAAHNIATYYAKGTGVEKDAAKAVEWYKKAAEKGITASQVQLGKLLYSVDIEGLRDRNAAVDLLKQAANSGDNDAKVALAILYLQGDEIGGDPLQGKRLLQQAAETGHPGAALRFGHLCSGKIRLYRQKPM